MKLYTYFFYIYKLKLLKIYLFKIKRLFVFIKMPFDIETYLSTLPNNITHINISAKGLTYLPDLSRFNNDTLFS